MSRLNNRNYYVPTCLKKILFFISRLELEPSQMPSTLHNLPSLSSLRILKENDAGLWISLDEFCRFLKGNHQVTDSTGPVRKANLKRALELTKEYCFDPELGDLIVFDGIIRFVVKNTGAIAVCDRVFKEIRHQLLKSSDEEVVIVQPQQRAEKKLTKLGQLNTSTI